MSQNSDVYVVQHDAGPPAHCLAAWSNCMPHIGYATTYGDHQYG